MPRPSLRSDGSRSYNMNGPSPTQSEGPEAVFAFGSTDGLYHPREYSANGPQSYSNPAASIDSLDNLTQPEVTKPDVNGLHNGHHDLNNGVPKERGVSVTSENDIHLGFDSAGYKTQISTISGAPTSDKKRPSLEAKWIPEGVTGDGQTQAKKTHPCRTKKCVVMSSLSVVLIVAAAVGLAVYFLVIKKSTTQPPVEEKSLYFSMSIKIPLTQAELNASDFKENYARLPDVVKNRLREIMTSRFGSTYDEAKLYDLKIRNGSIVADFHLIYNEKVETKKVKESLNKELTQLKLHDKKYWKLDPDIKVKALFHLPPQTSPAGGTSTVGATSKLSQSVTRTGKTDTLSLTTTTSVEPTLTLSPTPSQTVTSSRTLVSTTFMVTSTATPVTSLTSPSSSVVPTPTTPTPTPEFRCKSNEFECHSGQCIYAHQRCDSTTQCDDKSDELNCTGVCERGLHRCPEGKCIMTEWLCDGDWDCINGSDEQGCRKCNANDFQCADFSCVPSASRCDGVSHCNDSSDEHHCVKVNNKTNVVESYHQGEWLPLCSSGVNTSIGEDICTSIGGGYLQQLTSVFHTSSFYLHYQPNKNKISLPGMLHKRNTCTKNQVVRVKCSDLVCGTPASSVLRPYVVHGYVAPQGKWPWQVSVRKFQRHLCGGIVLTERHILTAAHCVQGHPDSPHIYEVVLATTKLFTVEPTRVTAAVIKMWKHPLFNNFTEGHDVAVLMLKNPIHFSSKIRPVCLPRSGTDRFPVTARCYVTGWGYTDYYKKTSPDDLQEAKMQLWNMTKCNSTDFYNSTLPSSVLCAGYLSGYISICPGDSGGPLMCQDEHGRWRVVGISSFMASGCDVPFRPSVFTDVLKEMDFIENVTSCQFRCNNKKCLYDETLICNRVDDCGDNSDELKKCNFNINCTFEDVFICGYKDDRRNPLNWTRHHGDTPTADTGPSGSHSGFYMYLEASDGKYGNSTFLWSPTHTSGQTSCLKFNYHMYGAHTGKLTVLLYNETAKRIYQVWTASGNQGNKWRMGQAQIKPGTYRVLFQATQGNGVLGDIALDNILLLPGKCDEFTCGSDEFKCKTGNQCINKNQKCDVSSQCSDRSDENDCNWSVQCNFELPTMCGWTNYGRYSNYNWRWHQGETPTKGIGPKHDHTYNSSKNGHYVYLDASTGKAGQRADFLSQPYTTNKTFWCFEFYYHMLGKPGQPLSQELQFNVYVNSNWYRWTQWNMNTGDKWRMERLTLSGGGSYYIALTGEKKGDSNLGDIAIDDVKTYDGACKKLVCPLGQVKCAENYECINASQLCDGFIDCFDAEDEINCTKYSTIINDTDPSKTLNLDCNFDHGNVCAYTAEKHQDLQFIIWKKLTPSAYTGPYFDNTTPKGLGNYVYLEANMNRNKKSRLVSPNIRISEPHCLRFHYHMYGSGMGHLEVFVEDPAVPGVHMAKWFLAGNQGNKWRYAQLTIPGSGRRRIVFEGKIGINLHSDIALDDIIVRKGACSEYKCPNGEYTCRNNSKCIPRTQVCDAVNDCYDYDDEKNCQCRPREFHCDMGMCIMDVKRCNQKKDCPDNSDERNCMCQPHEFQCLTGHCIPRYLRCDSKIDCPDYSDELFCPCSAREKPCKAGGCVIKEWVCDREPDCSDGSDEWNCTNSTCTSNQFICKDYTCIQMASKCNGVKDCPDGSDEHDCLRLSLTGIVRAYHGGQYLPICAIGWQTSYNNGLCQVMGYKTAIVSGKKTLSEQRYLASPSPIPSSGIVGNFLPRTQCPGNEVLTMRCMRKECGQPVETIITTYMTNGKSSTPTRWPWTVAILEAGVFGCGGTLINHEVVVTAAHCFPAGSPLSRFSFILGSKFQSLRDDVSPRQVRRTASKIIVHQLYNHQSTDYEYDIALVFLNEPVGYTDHVKPICLPDIGERFPTSSLCYISGWGSINRALDSPSSLQEAKMRLWLREKCNYRTHWNGHIGQSQMCAGYDNGPHSICPGDSGGPLVCLNQFKQWVLVGISSFFEKDTGCTTVGQPPNGFSNVTLLRPWIDQSLTANCSFNCSNGRCLYNVALKCNSKDDCGDNSDEGPHCSVSQPGCKTHEFHCNNDTCIPKTKYCDGFPDCQNGEDEPVKCNCDSNSFMCKNGRQCITKDRVCNHKIDCFDKSDETSCACKDKEFKCNNGLCVRGEQRCNMIIDCEDYSDEFNCTCNTTNNFRCNNSICIPLNLKCNGMDECGDNSDEIGCPCLNRQKKCSNDQCIQQEWVCDGYHDCSDKSDEQGCRTCSSREFQCRDYSCVPKIKRCDGVADCQDQSDEDGCFQFYPASLNLFGMVRKNVGGAWRYVCSEDWNTTFSDRFCQEIGFGTSNETRKVGYNTTEGYVQVKQNVGNQSFLTGYFQPGSCPSKQVAWVKCNSKECGKRSPNVLLLTSYIMGGQFAQNGEWPWMGAVYYLDYFHCGATLITEQFLITAAHCFHPNKHLVPHNVKVTLGTINSLQPEGHSATYAVRTIIPHPNYTNDPVPGNDIALIRLKTPVKITDYIRPVCLPTETQNFGEKSNCYVAGWGITSHARSVPSKDRLRKAKMQLWDPHKCKGVFGGNFNETSQVCAGYNMGYITACKGDSGGPLMCLDANRNWVLTGTLSFGMDCSTIQPGESKPDVSMKIAYYSDWIKKTLKQYE